MSLFASGLNYTTGLAFNSAGNLFVASGNAIQEFSPNGVQSTFASVSAPGGLAFDSAGNLFVTAGTSIIKITPSGVCSTFVSEASGLVNLNIGPAFDSAGNLYVAQWGNGITNNGSIIEIAPDGKQSTFASGLYSPGTLAFQPAPVPEPSAFGLLAVGATAFLVRRRCKLVA